MSGGGWKAAAGYIKTIVGGYKAAAAYINTIVGGYKAAAASINTTAGGWRAADGAARFLNGYEVRQAAAPHGLALTSFDARRRSSDTRSARRRR